MANANSIGGSRRQLLQLAGLPRRRDLFKDSITITNQVDQMVATFSLYDDEDLLNPILEFDNIIVGEIQITEVERVQKVPLFRRQSQLYAYGRDVRAISLNGVAIDAEDLPEEDGTGTRNQITMIELAHWKYFRTPKLAQQKRTLFLSVAGMTFSVGAIELGRGSTADAPTIDVVQWRFLILNDLSNYERLLSVVSSTNAVDPLSTLDRDAGLAARNRRRTQGGGGVSVLVEKVNGPPVGRRRWEHAVSQEGLIEVLPQLAEGTEDEAA